jgi:hypothetical protein
MAVEMAVMKSGLLQRPGTIATVVFSGRAVHQRISYALISKCVLRVP